MRTTVLRHWLPRLAIAAALAASMAPVRADGLAEHRFVDLGGRAVAGQALRGHVSIVNFWATWCAPCRQEMPMLDHLHRDLRSQNVEVIGIALDDSTAVRDFVSKLRVRYPIWFDSGDTLSLMRELGNTRGVLPFTVILDRQGRPSARITGSVTEAMLRAAVRDAR